MNYEGEGCVGLVVIALMILGSVYVYVSKKNHDIAQKLLINMCQELEPVEYNADKNLVLCKDKDGNHVVKVLK